MALTRTAQNVLLCDPEALFQVFERPVLVIRRCLASRTLRDHERDKKRAFNHC